MTTGPRARLLVVLASAVVIECSGESVAPPPAPKFTEVDVQVALHRAAGVPVDAPCRFRPFLRKPGAIVALCAPTVGTSTTIAGPYVVLAEPRGARLAPVASVQLAMPETHCEVRSGDLRPSHQAPRFELVTWGYRVARDSIAIGVRFTCLNESAGGEGSETRLYLLEPAGATLREIFDQAIGWTHIDRALRQQRVTQGAVIVQSKKHDAYFDLVLHTTARDTSYAIDSMLPSTQERSTVKRFVFSGDRYVPALDDTGVIEL